jgi:hypothetical protein
LPSSRPKTLAQHEQRAPLAREHAVTRLVPAPDRAVGVEAPLDPHHRRLRIRRLRLDGLEPVFDDEARAIHGVGHLDRLDDVEPEDLPHDRLHRVDPAIADRGRAIEEGRQIERIRAGRRRRQETRERSREKSTSHR